MSRAKGYAASSATEALAPFSFERREPGERDLEIQIEFCGVCHSDLHQARNDWANSTYPMVPGHEIIGRVTRSGAGAKKAKVGDRVGVGPMVDSCRVCSACREGLEQYCENGTTWTYNCTERVGGAPTQGGYSDHIVVDEHFAVRVPEALDPKAAAPLLCAGITTYSPLRHWGVGKGQRVGVIGLGGLGHMGLQFAKALGAEVVLLTTSPAKAKDAPSLGADSVLVSTDAAAMTKAAGSFHFLLNTAPNGHDLNPYMALLRREGTMVIVGALTGFEPPLQGLSLIAGRKRLSGSSIAGMAETQEMLDFCAQHGIASRVEVVKIQAINEVYERLLKGDVRYRFVIDMGSLKG